MIPSDAPRSLPARQAIDAPPLEQRLPLAPEQDDFSLVFGGPCYRLWCRAHLSGAKLELLRRRVIVLMLLAWVPLLILSLVEGKAWGGVALPFLYDVELHARLLLALPLLILAEPFVYERMRRVTRLFLERGLVPDSARSTFDAAIASAMRMRNSVVAEVLLLAFVYLIGVGVIWRTHGALDVASWYGSPPVNAPSNVSSQPTLAGWWLGLVSLPLFQFLLLRWYFRLFVWARFLWQVSRIQLDIMPMHPDRCGGLGFLSFVGRAFAPLLLAQGTVLAGMMANRIFYQGASLLEFETDLIGLISVLVLAILGPLLVLSPQLAQAKRKGVREYGTLGMRYAREFDRKWIRSGPPAAEPLIGTADIQSLADLGNSFEVLRGMRVAPFTLLTILQLAGTALVPILPLTLTLFSVAELFDKVLNLFF